MSFLDSFALFIVGCPVLAIALLCAVRVLDLARTRLQGARIDGRRPGLMVHRRRGLWCWRTAA